MKMTEERKAVVAYCKMLQEKNLTHGTGGNISILDKETGLVAISPSGVPYEVLKEEDVVIVDMEGNVVEGDLKPSSELHLHLEAYKANADFKAVVHTHSLYATTVACMNRSVPAVHYLIGFGGSDHIPCIPYYLYGSRELADAAGKKFAEEQDVRVILLGNHGLLSGGANVEQAFAQADSIEFVCELYTRLLQTGDLHILTPEQMKVVVEKFKTYGQK